MFRGIVARMKPEQILFHERVRTVEGADVAGHQLDRPLPVNNPTSFAQAVSGWRT
jgi:hypothetical protein